MREGGERELWDLSAQPVACKAPAEWEGVQRGEREDKKDRVEGRTRGASDGVRKKA